MGAGLKKLRTDMSSFGTCQQQDAFMTTSIELEIGTELLTEATEFVRDGWSPNLNVLMAEALRRYLDSHSPKVTEKFIRQDIDWGLHGKD